MAMTVEIRINGRLIRSLSAQNVSGDARDSAVYKITEDIDGGCMPEWDAVRIIGQLSHRRSDGAEVLAEKMLEAWRKTRQTERENAQKEETR